jgi:protein required for attachment to host cells
MLIPHNCLVLVGDGRRALFLRNKGTEQELDLRAEKVLSDENPRSAEQGTDRPGRTFARAHTTRRGSVEGTDWHELQQHRFVGSISARLEQLARSDDLPALVLAAPARTLAELRRSLPANVKSRIIAEARTDLTKHPVAEIEAHLLRSHES